MAKSFLNTYRGGQRVWRKLFSVMVSGGFAEFGSRSVLAPPIRLEGVSRIAIGSGVFVGPGGWLHTEGPESGVAIEIGDGTSLGAYSAVSAVRNVRIGRDVLTARGIYISDHSHEFSDFNKPVRDQGLTKIRPVEIADGVWLGEGVVVCPGVRIGRGAVIGANSVVISDVPDGAVAVGAPARVVRVRDGAQVLGQKNEVDEHPGCSSKGWPENPTGNGSAPAAPLIDLSRKPAPQEP